MTGETKQSDETTAELDYSRGPFLLSQGFGGEVVAIFSYVLFFGSGAGNRRGFGTFRFSCLSTGVETSPARVANDASEYSEAEGKGGLISSRYCTKVIPSE